MLAHVRGLAFICIVASLLAGCATSQGNPSPSVPSPSPSPTLVPPSTASTSSPSVPVPTARPSMESAASVMTSPDGILPPAGIAVVTADGVRVREGGPGSPGHAHVIYTLNDGDVVFVGDSNSSAGNVFGYVGPEESPDGRGWYLIHAGGEWTNDLDRRRNHRLDRRG